MELSGVMDDKFQNLQDHCAAGESGKSNSFTVCDLADEEVHFSRDASDYYFRMDKPQSAARTGAPNSLGASQPGGAASVARQPRSSPSSIHSLDTNNLNFGLTSEPGGGSHYIELSSSADQARSSKLLNTIGNKLRRGSNYLNAPTRLLGHYLLGITIQSWSEFFNTSRMMSTPKTRHQLARRLATNLSHFQGNYLCVSLVLVIYCILTSPLLLIAIAAYLLALYLVTVRSALGKQTRVFGYRLNLQQQYSFLTMLSIPPLWIAGAPSAVFWVIGASFFVVGLHASMFLNDQVLSEQATTASAIRALPYELARRQSTEPANRDAGSPSLARRTAAQYYNHYPSGLSDKQAYHSLSHGSNRDAHSITGSSQSTTGGSYVSSTISQWISFGAGGGGGGRYAAAKDSDTAARSTSTNPTSVDQQRAPDVKIISRDYAGLGRVYEV